MAQGGKYAIKHRLERYAHKKGLKGAAANRYTYGTITKITKRKRAKRRGR